MHPRNPHRWNRPDMLKEHYATLRGLGKSVHSKGTAVMESTGKFLKGTTEKPLYIVISALAFILLLITILHLRSISNFEDQMQQAVNRIGVLEHERDQYKERYQLILEDAQALGIMHGVLLNRSGPLEQHLTRPNLTAAVQSQAGQFASPARGKEIKLLPELSPWVFFNQEGLINDSCYTTTKLVQGADDVVNISFTPQTTTTGLWPAISVLVDGTLIGNHLVTDTNSTFKARVALPSGTYHVDILYADASTGPISIPSIKINNRTINNSVALIDYGTELEMFDCQDTVEGSTIRREGAMRIRIDKV